MAYKRIERKDAVEEIQKTRIRDALARPIDPIEVRSMWTRLKKTHRVTRRLVGIREVKEMMNDLRGASLSGLELEDLLLLSCVADDLKAAHSEYKIPVPEWLSRRQEEIGGAIVTLRKSALESKVRELKDTQERLKSTEQKRKDVDAELAEVQAALSDAD